MVGTLSKLYGVIFSWELHMGRDNILVKHKFIEIEALQEA